MAVSVTPTGDVTVTKAEAGAGGAAGATGAAGGGTRLQLEKPKGASGGSWVLTEAEFGPGLVGGKSANLAALRSKLPAG